MSKRAAAVLIAGFLTVLAAYGVRYSYGTLLPAMLPALQISKTQAGAIYSSFFLAYTCFSPLMGILSDRYDMRLLIALSVAVMGLGTFLMQFSSSLPQACLFFALAGAGAAACWAPVMAVSQRWTPSRRRGLMLALVDAGSTLGVMAAGSLIPWLTAGVFWQKGWLWLGLFGLVLGVLDYFLIRSYPPASAGKPSPAGPPQPLAAGYRRYFTDRRFWLVALAYLLTGFAVMVPFTFISTCAIQERGFSYAAAGVLVTVIGVGGLAGKLTLGPLSDRLGRVAVMVICAGLVAAGCLGIAFGRGAWLYPAAAVFGAGYGATWSMYAACAADFFSVRSAGGVIGLWTFYLGIGLLSSPVIAGWIGDSTGSLTGAFLLAAAAGVVSLLLLLPLWRLPRSA